MVKLFAMKEVIVKVPDKKYKFFMELIQCLGFVKVEKTDAGDSKEEIIANLKSGFAEMKLIKEGKMQGTPLKDFLNEL